MNRKPTHTCYGNSLLVTIAFIAIVACMLVICLLPALGMSLWAFQHMRGG